MSDILSRDEVDALLQGLADGVIAASGPATAAPKVVRALDLTAEERSLRGRMPGLELVVDRFARALGGSLGAFLGGRTRVTVTGLERVRFTHVRERLPRPAALVLFKLAPLRGRAMVIVPPPLVGALLQGFFGGAPNRRTPMPAREFSAIEVRAVERLAARVLHDLREAWRPVVTLEPAPIRVETNATFAAIAEPAEPVVLVELRVELDAGSDATLSLCIPDAALDPLRGRLARAVVNGGTEGEPVDAAWAERLRAALAEVEVEVSAELGTCPLSLRALLNLRAGDVLPLTGGVDRPALVRVAGQPHFVGTPGVAKGSNAVRLTARA